MLIKTLLLCLFSVNTALLFGQLPCSGSASLAVTIEDCVGISEISSSPVFQITPNPTTGVLTIQTNDHRFYPIDFELRSATSTRIQTGIISKSNSILDISSLPSGTYFLHFSIGKHAYFQRIIKI